MYGQSGCRLDNPHEEKKLTCDTNVWRTVGVTARPTVAVFMRFMLLLLTMLSAS